MKKAHWLTFLVFLHGFTFPTRAGEVMATQSRLEDPTSQVVVFPGVGSENVNYPIVQRFLSRYITTKYPELEPAGRRAGGLLFKVRGALAPELLADLQRLPNVAGASPLPSTSELLRERSRQLARGGIESLASGLIVRYRGIDKRRGNTSELSAGDLQRVAQIIGRPVVRSRLLANEAIAIDFGANVDILAAELAALRMEQSPEIEFASPNGYATVALNSADSSFGLQWNLTDPIAGINVRAAWDITTGASQIVTAVVDTGLLGHPEFTGRLLAGVDFISDPVMSNDGDGRDGQAMDSGTWAPAGVCAGGAAVNSNWHGTHVAGIIGASGNNGVGIAGINWVSRILPVRALGRCGSGSESDILDAFSWAAGLPVPGIPNNPTPARVINMSLSGTGNCVLTKPAYQVAVLKALAVGATVVVAAGNDNETALVRVPASCIGTIKVAATGPTGDKAPYSNYSKAIEIAAPGGDVRMGQSAQILSTVASGLQGDAGSPTLGYKQGTSMAAPHVAGVASLMLSVRPTLTVAQVRDLIRATAKPFPVGSSCAAFGDCGLGIVDAGRAVQLATQTPERINFSDLWWVPDESGWGLNLQQQGEILFGTWFTYGPDGRGKWYVLPSINRVGDQDYFVGDIYETTGTPFNLINGQPALLQATKVGEALFAFFGVGINANPNLNFDSAIFYYELPATSDAKPIQRQSFSSQTICRFTSGTRQSTSNYQDLWWNPSESGWGVNLTHQGDILFATWFTYGASGQQVWLVGPDVRRTGLSTFTGRLYQTTGVPLTQILGTEAIKTVTDVGQISFTFQDGERGRMDYQVAGFVGSKQIQRQVFSSPLTACRSGT